MVSVLSNTGHFPHVKSAPDLRRLPSLLMKKSSSTDDLNFESKSPSGLNFFKRDRQRHRSAPERKESEEFSEIYSGQSSTFCADAITGSGSNTSLAKPKMNKDKNSDGPIPKRKLPFLSFIPKKRTKLKVDLNHPWTEPEEDSLSPILENKLQLQKADPVILSAEKTVGYNGGTINIPGTRITLIIPEGALKRGQTERIKVSTSYWACLKRPSVEFPRLTPVVRFEPSGLKFDVPAQLVLPHCGVIPDPQGCIFRVFYHHYEEGNQPNWIEEEETEMKGLTSWLTSSTCYLFIPHFSWYDVIIGGVNMKAKRLRVFPMANKVEENDDQMVVNLWVCDDESSSYEEILRSERQLGKCLMDSYTSYVMYGTKQPLVFKAEKDKASQWKLISECKKTVDFQCLWNESGRANVKFRFQMKGKIKTKKGTKLNHEFKIWQNDSSSIIDFFVDATVNSLLKLQQQNTGSRPTPEVEIPSKNLQRSKPGGVSATDASMGQQEWSYMDPNMSIMIDRPGASHHSMSDAQSISLLDDYMRDDLPFDFSQLSQGPADNSLVRVPCQALGFDLLCKLSKVLLPPDPLNNGWERLADYFSFSYADINYLRHRFGDPPMKVLEICCRRGLINCPTDLIPVFEEIGRRDAVAIIKQHVEETTKGAAMSRTGSFASSDVSWRTGHHKMTSQPSFGGEPMSVSPEDLIDDVFNTKMPQARPYSDLSASKFDVSQSGSMGMGLDFGPYGDSRTNKFDVSQPGSSGNGVQISAGGDLAVLDLFQTNSSKMEIPSEGVTDLNENTVVGVTEAPLRDQKETPQGEMCNLNENLVKVHLSKESTV